MRDNMMSLSSLLTHMHTRTTSSVCLCVTFGQNSNPKKSRGVHFNYAVTLGDAVFLGKAHTTSPMLPTIAARGFELTVLYKRVERQLYRDA